MVFADNVTAVLWCVLYIANNIKYTLRQKDKKVNTGLCFGPLTRKMTGFDLSLVVTRTSPSKVKTETTTWKYQDLQIPFLVCLRSKGENIEINEVVLLPWFFQKLIRFLFLILGRLKMSCRGMLKTNYKKANRLIVMVRISLPFYLS